MAYERQIQEHLNNLDKSLLALNRLIKEGKQKEAIEYMERGPLKESFEDLQNMITLSKRTPYGSGLGARGTTQTGTL